MKKILLFILVVFVSIPNITAQSLQLSEGNIRFISDKKGFSAENTDFKSEINVTNKTISFKIPITGFIFKKKKMQDHFNDKGVMDSEKYSHATFEGKIITDSDLSVHGTYNVTVSGKIKIRDVEKDYKAEGSIKTTSDGIAVKSEFLIVREDFNIKGFYASMTDDIIKVFLVAVYK